MELKHNIMMRDISLIMTKLSFVAFETIRKLTRQPEKLSRGRLEYH